MARKDSDTDKSAKKRQDKKPTLGEEVAEAFSGMSPKPAIDELADRDHGSPGPGHR